MQILMFLLAFSLLVALYFFVPKKKIFLLFSLTLILASGIFFTLTKKNTPPPLAKEEEILLITREQTAFYPFFASYQKYVEQIGYNNQVLNNIVTNFSDDLISIETVKERLALLIENQKAVELSLKRLEIPQELQAKNQKLAEELISRTISYQREGRTAAEHLLKLAEKVYAENLPYERQSEELTLLFAKEAPTALFTAEIIMMLKNNLTVPPN